MGWILGVDPGAKGGFCVIHEDLSIETWKMPESAGKIVRLIEGFAEREGCEKVILEEVWGRAGNSARSNTTFMRHVGLLKGSILTAFDILRGGFPLFQEVKPQTWQADLGISKKSKDKTIKAHKRERMHKNALKDFASAMYPDHKLNLYIADAVLIAVWGARSTWDVRDG